MHDLLVCFEPPSVLSDDVTVLSFLGPLQEEELRSNVAPQRFVSGRAYAAEIRPVAREAFRYCLTVPIMTPGRDGRTLREILQDRDGTSLWWYHPLSQKDSIEPNSVYTDIVRLYIIRKVATEFSIDRIKFFGGRFELAPCLIPSFRVESTTAPSSGSLRAIFSQSLRHRWRHFQEVRRTLSILRRMRWQELSNYDVIFQAFWRWTFRGETGNLKHTYFGDLPECFREHRLKVAYLTAVELVDVKRAEFASSASEDGVIILQRFLKWRDLICVFLDFRPALIWRRYAGNPSFRSLFVRDGLDLFPLFRNEFERGFWDFAIPRFKLREIAARRVIAKIKPRILGTFLEFFLESRPLYAAARQSGCPVTFAAQHAVITLEKTFNIPDKIEMEEYPDGSGMPVPQVVFTMGEYSRKIWSNAGYPDRNLVVAGGLRYQHLHPPEKGVRANILHKPRNILLVAAMNECQDLEMCESVLAATKSLANVNVIFREHPHYPLRNRPEFAKFKVRFEFSSQSVSTDLDRADLVVSTHSSMAEEALVVGIPVWIWDWAGCNASSLMEFEAVPIFSSVSDLRTALETWIESPEKFTPEISTRDTVFRELYSPDPAGASGRIASDLLKRITERDEEITK